MIDLHYVERLGNVQKKSDITIVAVNYLEISFDSVGVFISANAGDLLKIGNFSVHSNSWLAPSP